jgi:hypothetical protein
MKSAHFVALAFMLATPLAANAAHHTAKAAAVAPAAKVQKVVIQVSDADPKKWALALNNAKNVQSDLGKDGSEIEIVAYGPGIGMLKTDSVEGVRVAEAMTAGVKVVACVNTMTNMKLTKEDMLPNIGYVPAGVVELMKKQHEGYAYIRP